jgi:hypothetical protein
MTLSEKRDTSTCYFSCAKVENVRSLNRVRHFQIS